jgi:hypothetical protein
MSEEENVAISLKVLAEILGQTVDFKEPPQGEQPTTDLGSKSSSGNAVNKEEAWQDDPDDRWGVGILGSSRRRNSNTRAWHTNPSPEQEKKEGPGVCEPKKLSQALDYSTFHIGEPVAEDVCFCSWNLVVGYPERYIGKASKPRVGSLSNSSATHGG